MTEHGLSRRRFLAGTAAASGAICLGVTAGGPAAATPATAMPSAITPRAPAGQRGPAATPVDPGELGAGLFRPVETAPRTQALLDTSFEQHSTSWFTADLAGDTVADVVDGAGRTGTAAGHIHVPEDVPLGWPVIAQDVTGIAAGTPILVTAWLRPVDVRDGVGAYVSVSYFDANGERIAFSQSGALNGTQDWSRLFFFSVVPAGTVTVSPRVTLHGHGTCYYDDITLDVLHVQEPAHQDDVDLAVSTTVLNADLYGLAVENNPFLFRDGGGMTDAYLAQFRARLGAIAPVAVRVFMTPQWFETSPGVFDFSGDLIRAFARTLSEYQIAGIEANVVFVDWSGTPWTPDQFPRLIDIMTGVLDWLGGQQITNVTMLTIFNEPNISWGGSTADYENLYRQLRTALDGRGYGDIGLVGSDSAFGPGAHYSYVATHMADVVEGLSYHDYPYYTGVSGSLINAGLASDIARENGITRVVEWETALHGIGAGTYTAGTSEDGTLLPKRFPTALTFAAYALQTLASGVHGVCYWEVADMYYGTIGDPANFMQLGMWGSPLAGMELRPMHYGFAFLSRFIRPGATLVATSQSIEAALIAYTVENADGSRASYVINPWPDDTNVTLDLGQSAATVRRYVLSDEQVKAAIAAGSLELPADEIRLRRIKVAGEVRPRRSGVADVVRGRSAHLYYVPAGS